MATSDEQKKMLIWVVVIIAVLLLVVPLILKKTGVIKSNGRIQRYNQRYASSINKKPGGFKSAKYPMKKGYPTWIWDNFLQYNNRMLYVGYGYKLGNWDSIYNFTNLSNPKYVFRNDFYDLNNVNNAVCMPWNSGTANSQTFGPTAKNSTSSTTDMWGNNMNLKGNISDDGVNFTTSISNSQSNKQKVDIQIQSLSLMYTNEIGSIELRGDEQGQDYDKTCRFSKLNPIMIKQFLSLPLEIIPRTDNPYNVNDVSNDNQWTDYTSFFDTWGDHVVTTLHFGARAALNWTMQSDETTITDEMTTKACLGVTNLSEASTAAAAADKEAAAKAKQTADESATAAAKAAAAAAAKPSDKKLAKAAKDAEDKAAADKKLYDAAQKAAEESNGANYNVEFCADWLKNHSSNTKNVTTTPFFQALGGSSALRSDLKDISFDNISKYSKQLTKFLNSVDELNDDKSVIQFGFLPVWELISDAIIFMINKFSDTPPDLPAPAYWDVWMKNWYPLSIQQRNQNLKQITNNLHTAYVKNTVCPLTAAYGEPASLWLSSEKDTYNGYVDYKCLNTKVGCTHNNDCHKDSGFGACHPKTGTSYWHSSTPYKYSCDISRPPEYNVLGNMPPDNNSNCWHDYNPFKPGTGCYCAENDGGLKSKSPHSVWSTKNSAYCG